MTTTEHAIGEGEAALRAAIRRFRQDSSETPLRIRLWTLLCDRMSLDEVRDVCFLLGTDYDALNGETKGGKVRELVAYYDRREDLDALVAAVTAYRPDLRP